MGIKRRVCRVGSDSVGVVIPRAVVQLLGLNVGDEVEVTVEKVGEEIGLRMRQGGGGA